MNISIKSAVTAIFLPLMFLQSSGKEIFVSPSGNDRNPGSRQAPLATIAAAAARAKAGDTVNIAPGVYREKVIFRKSGTHAAPITVAGTRGKNGEYLSIIEAPGVTVSNWQPAPEIAPGVWKAPLPQRPDLVMMDGRMIALINRWTMALPRRKELPQEISEEMFWDKFSPQCRRLAGFDLLSLSPETMVRHRYFGKRKERFYEVLAGVLAGWHQGYLYLRFARSGKPQQHRITATRGGGFKVQNASYLVFKNLHMRGSRQQFRLSGKSSHNTIDNCLLMHGGSRVYIEKSVSKTVVKNCLMTAGFIRDDLFQLRSAADMRGGLLYLIFKYVIGVSSSDDTGVRDYGENTLISGNVIIRGLIGIGAGGRNCEVENNVVREMSSVGICTYATTSGKFHDNLVMNCGIPLRIHDLRAAKAKREEFHYRNLFVQAPHGGSQIYVHCESHRWGPDKINFKSGTNEYLKNPPAPVDAGKFYIYHNTFWGGDDFSRGFTVRYLAKRFRMVMPFVFINNIIKGSHLLDTASQTLLDHNLLYTFAPGVRKLKQLDPAVAQRNRLIGVKAGRQLWQNNPLSPLPEVTIGTASPARNCGVDVSKPFTVNGKTFSALPGFSPGYFTGERPAAGALQFGESMDKFLHIHRKTEALIKLIR